MECCYKETVLIWSAVIKRLFLYGVLLYRDCSCMGCCYKETVLIWGAVIKRLFLYGVLL